MSTNAQKRVRRIKLTTAGEFPAGNMDIVPYTNWQINGPLTREQPGNVQASRQPADNIAVDKATSGSATADWIYGQYDPELAAVMCTTMASAVTVGAATDIAAVVSGNKLTKGSGGWSTLAAGDVVRVSGFATNPATFVALVTAVSGGDLSLAWPTLSAESAGPSVTVTYAGRLRFGTELVLLGFEKFNTGSSKGDTYLDVGVSQAVLTVPLQGKCTLGFTYTAGKSPDPISAALANASNAASTNVVRNAGVDFQGHAVPTAGLGLRYGGTLLDVYVQSLTVTLTNPLLAAKGAGRGIGPQSLNLDQMMGVAVELKLLRNTADAETLWEDAQDEDTATSLGFGFRDAGGLRDYFWLPQVQPHGNNGGQQQQAGLDEVTISYMARYDSVVGMLQYTKLG